MLAKYPGTEEGDIAEFFLGTNAADDGNLPDAVKHFNAAIDSGNGPYASEAKLALAQVYAAQGKVNDGVKLIQSVIDHPTRNGLERRRHPRDGRSHQVPATRSAPSSW